MSAHRWSGSQSIDGMDELMEGFRRSTDIVPPRDLVERILTRVADEPPSTAPRRFLAALRALDAHGVWLAFRHNARAAFGPGTRSVVLRVQALSVVVLVIGTTGVGSVGAFAAAAHVVKEVRGPAIAEPDRQPRPAHAARSDAPPAAMPPSLQQADSPLGGEDAGAAAGPGFPVGPSLESESTPTPPGVAADPPPGSAGDKSPSVPKGNAYGRTGSPGRSGAAPHGPDDDRAPSAPGRNENGKTGSPGKSGAAPGANAGDKSTSKPGGKAQGQPASSGKPQGQAASSGKPHAASRNTGDKSTSPPGGNAGEGQVRHERRGGGTTPLAEPAGLGAPASKDPHARERQRGGGDRS